MANVRIKAYLINIAVHVVLHILIVIAAGRKRRAHLYMIFRLTDLWKVIVLSKGSVLPHQL